MPATAMGTQTAMLAYGLASSNAPKYRTWNGTSWSAAASAGDVGATPRWVVLRGSPLASLYVLGVLDDDEDLSVQAWNGASWSPVTEVTSNTGQENRRVFDLAYEQSSGHVLLVYREDGTTNLRYRTFDGSTWSGESSFALASKLVDWVRLAPRLNSDEILLTAVYTDDDELLLMAAIWNGTSFGNLSTLASDNDEDIAAERSPFDSTYETQSGHGLVAYRYPVSSTPRYRTWISSSWSSGLSMPSVGSEPEWIELAGDPASDEVLFGSLDDSKDINVNAWTGSAWGSNLEIETGAGSSDRRAFDIAYECGGNEGLIVYDEGSSNLRYRTWNGSSWSSESNGPACSASKDIIVQAVTGIAVGEVFVTFSDHHDAIHTVLWNGSSFGSTLDLGDQSDNQSESYMVAVAGSASATLTITGWTEVPNP